MYKLVLFALLPLLATARPMKRATQQIHPNGDTSRCLAIVGTPADGVATSVVPCSQAGAHVLWDIAPGNNLAVLLSGTSFALDAGVGPHNNGPAKIWTSYPGLEQQQWYYTPDLHIAITNDPNSQCLDLNQQTGAPQTYQCVGGNTNQIWTVNGGTSPTSATTTTQVSTTTSSSATSTASPPPPPPVSGGQQIHFSGGGVTGCLTANNGYAAVGTNVVIVACFPDTAPASQLALQLWNITRNAAAPITIAGSGGGQLCLDFGSNPGNTVQPHLWTCYDGLYQQTFWYTTDNHVAIYNGPGICLDVDSTSQPTDTKPYGSLKNVIEYSCSGTDPQQIFTL